MIENHIHHFGDYRLVPVWQAITPAHQERLVTFWLREGALPNAEAAAHRATDVVYLLETQNGEVAGVSTAYAAIAPRLEREFYFYRTFVAERYRKPMLPVVMLERTYDLLLARHAPGGPPGLMVAVENPKLTRRGIQRKLSKMGWRYLGLNPRGQQTWLRLF